MFEKQNIGKVTLGSKVRRAIWNIVAAILFRPFGTKLFRPWRLFLLRLFGANVSAGSEVYASAKIWAPWNLTMEKGSNIGPHAIVYNQAMVTLEEDACVSQYVTLCTAGHTFDTINNAESGLLVAPIRIERGAWIGMQAFVGMGVLIGTRAVVGACTCVFKDVEDWTIVGGNPAQVIRKLDHQTIDAK